MVGSGLRLSRCLDRSLTGVFGLGAGSAMLNKNLPEHERLLRLRLRSDQRRRLPRSAQARLHSASSEPAFFDPLLPSNLRLGASKTTILSAITILIITAFAAGLGSVILIDNGVAVINGILLGIIATSGIIVLSAIVRWMLMRGGWLLVLLLVLLSTPALAVASDDGVVPMLVRPQRRFPTLSSASLKDCFVCRPRAHPTTTPAAT